MGFGISIVVCSLTRAWIGALSKALTPVDDGRLGYYTRIDFKTRNEASLLINRNMKVFHRTSVQFDVGRFTVRSERKRHRKVESIETVNSYSHSRESGAAVPVSILFTTADADHITQSCWRRSFPQAHRRPTDGRP